MTTTSRDVELILKAKNLAAQPLAEVSAAVQKLVEMMDEITPAAQRGEGSIDELRSVSVQLEKALKALGGDKAILESFTALSTQISEQEKALAALQQRVEAAKAAYSSAETPTAELAKNVNAATKAFESQQKSLNRTIESMNTLRATAEKAGIDLDKFAQVEAKIETSLQQAIPAYRAINIEIDQFATNQRRARIATQEAQDVADRAAGATEAWAKAQRDATTQATAAVAAKDREIAASIKAAEAEDREIAEIQKGIEVRKQADAAEEARLRRMAKEADVENMWLGLLAKREVEERKAAEAAALFAANTERVAKVTRDGTVVEIEAVRARRQATQVLREEATATAQAAKAQGSLTNSFRLFRDEGRTTLAMFQRIRTELVSTVAAYAGLYAAVRSAGGVIDAVNKRAGVQNSLAVAFGRENVGDEMKYISAQAERLGFNMLDLGESYAKFAVASRQAGTSANNTRFIFETFTEASRVLHLSQEQTNYVFLALQQMMSKGKVNMQDLRQQLGDHLPGAIAIFAKALGVGSAEFEKMVEQGEVGSDTLALFADRVRKTFGPELANALHTPQAEVGRFQTALANLKLFIADSGFMDRFADLIKRLVSYLQSDAGRKFAEQLAAGFKAVGDALVWVVDHLEGIKNAIIAIVEARIAIAIAGAVSALGTLGTKVRELSGAFGDLRSGMLGAETGAPRLARALQGVANIGIAGMLGFDFGSWAYKQSAIVRAFGDLIVGIFEAVAKFIETTWTSAWKMFSDPTHWKQHLVAPYKAALAEMQASWDAASLQFKPAPSSTTAPGKAPGNTEADQAELDAARAKIAAAAEKSASDEKAIINQLHTFRAQVMKKDADTQAEYIAGLREQYAPLFDKIAEFGKANAANAAKAKAWIAELNSIINQAGALKGREFQSQDVQRREQEINSLVEERNHLIANQNKLKEAGVQSDETTRRNIAAFDAEYNAKIRPKIEAFIAFVNHLPAEVSEKFKLAVSDMTVMLQTLTDRPAVNPVKDAMAESERLNGIFAERTAALQAQRELLDAQGKSTREIRKELAETGNAYRDELLPQLDALIEKLTTSKDLTEEQRKSLQGVIQHLQVMKIRLGEEIVPSLLPVGEILKDWADGLTNVVQGFVQAAVASGKLSGGIRGALTAFRQFAADFLMKIAIMIIQSRILAALQAASKSGGWVGTAASWLSTVAGQHHSGGVVGSARVHRLAPSLAYVGAARFHSGGLPGFRPDEVPIIAQKGEEVLARGDPRNVLNGGGARSPLAIKVVNTVDSESVVQHGLSTASGERAIMNIIRANRGAIKHALA
jgi:tape measure domain-containing protein